MRYKVVLFDLDGTLVDTSDESLISQQKAAKKLGLKPFEKTDVAVFMGPSLYETATVHYRLDTEEAARYVELVGKHFDEAGGTVYPGVNTLLAELKAAKIRLGICTMKHEPTAHLTMKEKELFSYFEVIAGVDDAAPRSKAETIKDCLKRMEVFQKEEVLFVGDTAGDGLAAKETGIDFAAALYGFGFAEGVPKEIPCVFKIFYPEELKSLLFST